MDAVFDGPVTLQPGGQQSGVGGAVVQGGDRVDDLYRRFAGAAPPPADDLDRAAGVRKQVPDVGAVQINHLDRASLGAAVASSATPSAGRLASRQPSQRPAQQWLVALDGEQLVRRR